MVLIFHSDIEVSTSEYVITNPKVVNRYFDRFIMVSLESKIYKINKLKFQLKDMLKMNAF